MSADLIGALGKAVTAAREDRNTRIQTRLRREGVVDFEGMWLRHEGEWSDLAPGDSYAAERNQGPRLLTVREVRDSIGEESQFAGAVFAVENAYPYDLGECVKVSIHESDPRDEVSS